MDWLPDEDLNELRKKNPAAQQKTCKLCQNQMKVNSLQFFLNILNVDDYVDMIIYKPYIFGD